MIKKTKGPKYEPPSVQNASSKGEAFLIAPGPPIRRGFREQGDVQEYAVARISLYGSLELGSWDPPREKWCVSLCEQHLDPEVGLL